MSEVKTYRRKKTKDGHLIEQSNLKFVNQLKKYCCVNEIRMFVNEFKMLKRYRKLKDYTLKTSINTEQKTIEVWAFNKKKELEFKDFYQLSTTSYLLNFDTIYFKEKVYKHVIINPSNEGLITIYENGEIDKNNTKNIKVRILRDKSAQKTNPNCVYVIKDINKGRRYYHIESDISNYLLEHDTPPLPNGDSFKLVVPPKKPKNGSTAAEYMKNIKPEYAKGQKMTPEEMAEYLSKKNSEMGKK